MKLYVLVNLIDMLEKLFVKFGNDAFLSFSSLGTVYSQSTVVFNVFILSIYSVLHTGLLLLKVVALNAAVNSQTDVLTSLLISTQLVEVKKSVFKKYPLSRLEEIVQFDIIERFQIIIFLFVILSNNFYDSGILMLYQSLGCFLKIFVSEVFIDWIKHAFISHLNEIPTGVYEEMKITMCNSLTNGKGSLVSDLRMSRAISFIGLPLMCVFSQSMYHLFQVISIWNITLILLSLIILKTLNRSYLISYIQKTKQTQTTKRNTKQKTPHPNKPIQHKK
eukprot:TRINITY_DN786_c0_g1_i8.p2 TRINITY_DN786_c0_g1~~TRINITY_DN786_c0_g1_i8.p2  ORF type:complete len:277 (+),score=35.37 TRINITY_DN786_c0_g1_i8:424-1254(+)